MKVQTLLLTLFIAVLSLGLSSCVVRGPGIAIAPVRVGFGVYDTLPPAYADPYYYYGGHYYYGGNWETGHYVVAGHVHTGRYFYNGRYIYGGRYAIGHRHYHR